METVRQNQTRISLYHGVYDQKAEEGAIPVNHRVAESTSIDSVYAETYDVEQDVKTDVLSVDEIVVLILEDLLRYDILDE